MSVQLAKMAYQGVPEEVVKLAKRVEYIVSRLNPLHALVDEFRSRVARMLAKKLKKIPRHVAIIPDGNRRWARRRKLPEWVGHVAGYLRLRRVLDLLWSLGVQHVTVYVMSRENCLRRSSIEKRRLYSLLVIGANDVLRDGRVRRGLVRVRAVGDLSLLPSHVAWVIRKVEEATRNNGPSTLNICICYSGRWEIVEAVNRLLRSGCPVSVDEDMLSRNMPLHGVPEPDLVIRTGGELRLSNFLLWHLSYSELYFTKKLWPDFDDLEVVRALLSFQSRERRFGR